MPLVLIYKGAHSIFHQHGVDAVYDMIDPKFPVCSATARKGVGRNHGRWRKHRASRQQSPPTCKTHNEDELGEYTHQRIDGPQVRKSGPHIYVGYVPRRNRMEDEQQDGPPLRWGLDGIVELRQQMPTARENRKTNKVHGCKHIVKVFG